MLQTTSELRSLRDSLDLTDVCIIDGDEQTVTFALRLPRETLRKNHHFLLAASEAANDARPSRVAAVPVVVTASHWITRAIKLLPQLGGAGTALIIMIAGALWAYHIIVPAVEWQSLLPDTPIIDVGRPLVLLVSSRHNRACQIFYDEALIDDKTNNTVWSRRKPATHTAVTQGFETFHTDIPIPLVAAGAYTLQLVGDFDCGLLDRHQFSVGNIHFMVRDTPAS